jgi:hypothetical protein
MYKYDCMNAFHATAAVISHYSWQATAHKKSQCIWQRRRHYTGFIYKHCKYETPIEVSWSVQHLMIAEGFNFKYLYCYVSKQNYKINLDTKYSRLLGYNSQLMIFTWWPFLIITKTLRARTLYNE